MPSSLDNSFSIQVGGSFIAPPSNSAGEKHQAKVGDSQPAIFSLQNGRLQSGDWVLARAMAEDRSFGPKMVFWFKADSCEGKIHPVAAEQEGESVRLTFNGMCRLSYAFREPAICRPVLIVLGSYLQKRA
ncbi:unnamed protein product [Periconia digitata]|uniref:Uncharacterized protein n=1 Tax=Periconia digitata TaxID=1303443 RepID=A0A9W4US94_9PLEO|nr:unnamed protein product [Periconia digitata]